MQIPKSEYNPELHDKYKGLTVKQPYADLLTVVAYRNEDGEYCAEKMIEVRSRNIRYRGDILICSSKNPSDLVGHLPGVTCGLVELYDVKRVEDFTEEDWMQTRIPLEKRPRKGFGWMMRNPRRVVEMPVKGQLGLYDIVVPKGDITEYPRMVAFGSEGWDIVQRKIKRIK